MIESLEPAQIGLVTAVGLALVGYGIAMTPLVRNRARPAIIPRLLAAAGLVVIAAYGFDLRSLLAVGVVAIGVVAAYDTRSPSGTPYPRWDAIAAAALLSGLAVYFALRGALPLLDRASWLPAVAAGVFGVAGALGTLAVADRERVRLHERLVVHRHAIGAEKPALPIITVEVEELTPPELAEPEQPRPYVNGARHTVPEPRAADEHPVRLIQ